MRRILSHPITAACAFAAAGLTFVACSESPTSPGTVLGGLGANANVVASLPNLGTAQATLNSGSSTHYCQHDYTTQAPVVGTFAGTDCATAANDLTTPLASYNPGWSAPFAGSAWIGPTGVDAPSNEYRAHPGSYEFIVPFNVPTGATNIVVQVQVKSDNAVVAYINGGKIGQNAFLQDCPKFGVCNWNVELDMNDVGHGVYKTGPNPADANLLRIDLVGTTIGLITDGVSAPASLCSDGPQVSGVGGVLTQPDHAAGGNSWSVADCLNPTGLDFVANVFWTPAPPPQICDFITFGRLVTQVGGDKIVISGNAGGNAPGGGILGDIEISVGGTQYHVPTIESYGLTTSGVLFPDQFARVITGHSGSHLVELRLRDNPNPGQGEPGTTEGDMVWLKIDNNVVVPLQTLDKGNIQLHLHCRGPGE